MTDETALLAAIRATPDDDSPRLIYADWLDEHNQPERAEFIRVQCELARVETPTLRQRERDLLAKHHNAFAKPIAASGPRYRFHRGLIVAFSHTGLFVRREIGELADQSWTHSALRFSSDGQVVCTMGQLYRDLTWQPWEETPCLRGTYRVDPLAYRPAFIQFALPMLEYRGQMLGPTIRLERRSFGLGPGVQEVFELVQVPGFDSFPET
jgi:uncharacterized protein (TIGR02996 family)